MYIHAKPAKWHKFRVISAIYRIFILNCRVSRWSLLCVRFCQPKMADAVYMQIINILYVRQVFIYKNISYSVLICDV